MRLYSIFRRFLRLATRFYFVEVRTRNTERVPTSGPVILAANHPSSILDSVLLTTEIERPVHYLAKSELFRSPWLARLYKRLGAVPINRGALSSSAQDTTFQQLYQVLEQGGCVGIFPEGRNSPQHQVARLRSGTARIALGAEARNQWRLGVQVVPVGLSFESRELFNSAVQLRFGPPIRVADYQAAFAADERSAVRALTRHMEQEIRALTLHIEDARLADLVEALAGLYAAEKSSRPRQSQAAPLRRSRRWRPLQRIISWFRPQLIEPIDLSGNLDNRQQLNQLLQSLARTRPDAIDELAQRVERYHAHLRQVALRTDLTQPLEQPLRDRLIRLRMTAYAILVAPVALFGLVHNGLPYLLSLLFGRRFDNEAVRAFAYFGMGVVSFSLTYSLFGFWMWQFTERSLVNSLLYLASLPPTGFIALRYHRRIIQYRDKILVRTFLRRESTMQALLREERNQIIERLRELEGQ